LESTVLWLKKAIRENSMRFFEALYNHSPVFFKNMMTPVYGWKLKRSRYGRTFTEHYAFLQASQFYFWEEEIMVS
jgi:flavodoxin